jgi:hypothetical protein
MNHDDQTPLLQMRLDAAPLRLPKLQGLPSNGEERKWACPGCGRLCRGAKGLGWHLIMFPGCPGA